MRNIKANLFPVFFKNRIGEEEILDRYGNPTGSFIPVYGELQAALLSISANKGTSEVELFGTAINYDRTMSTADTEIDIDEHSVLWLDGADTEGPWNYEVVTRSDWKNSVSFAISSVDISFYESYQKAVEQQKAIKLDLGW